MQVFCPYAEPIKTAECLDRLRLNKQLIECRQILDAIDGTGKGWFNHPVTKMYRPYRQWLYYYMQCLGCFQLYMRKTEHNYTKASHLMQSVIWSEKADKVRPPFINDAFCIQHRRRLYTKNSEHYKRFSKYGTSEENWYWDNESQSIIKYINGKRI